jgi:DNA-binding NtrC family response regulator
MNSSRATRIECVILTAFDSQFNLLKNIWALAGIRLHHAKTLEQADFLLMATEATVLLSDVAIVDSSWRSALEMIGHHHPLVIMLVVADPVDQSLLVDAFSLGVCGIIWTPIQFDAAAKLVKTAHQAYLDRQLLREECVKAACPGQSEGPCAAADPIDDQPAEIRALLDGDASKR